MANLLTSVVVFTAAICVAQSIVCFKGICDKLPKRVALQCAGGVITNGGFCGCFDVCAKQEGDECEASFVRGRLPLGTCDKGLTCQRQQHMVIGAGQCVKTAQTKPKSVTTRDTQTLCEERRTAAMISMVVYKGQWFPKCDAAGLFQAEQCDNTRTCFCVDVNTGMVDESTKVQLGHANCDSNTT